jgi:hypothetical protein
VTPQHIFIHGIYQRCGSNHLLHLLSQHPGISVFPRGVWEFPWLALAADLVSFDARFTAHPKVTEMQQGELLPAFGDAILDLLGRDTGIGQRLALKYPSVQNLDRFFDFFPDQRLVIVVRDGRDVACSAMKTAFARPHRPRLAHPGSWRFALQSPYVTLARRWALASWSIRQFLAVLEGTPRQHQVDVIRYEDLVQHRAAVLHALLRRLGLPELDYPWTEIDAQPVRGSSFVGASGDGQLDWRPAQIADGGFSPIGRWRQWDNRLTQRYERVASAELAVWGYGDALAPVDATLREFVIAP